MAFKTKTRIAAGCLPLLACLFGITPVGAAAAQQNGISIQQPWMRYIMPMRPAAGYFTLSNGTNHAAMLVGASSPACKKIMLHHSATENGVEKMAMVSQVRVPPHGHVAFAPGGYHLMCLMPDKTVKPGANVTIVLAFAGGERLRASFAVKGPAYSGR